MIIDIPYYEDMSRVSNSAIGWFLESPRHYKDMIDGNVSQKKSSAMENGSMVHMYLLQKEDFFKNYVILDFETPSSAQQRAFCEQYIRSTQNKPVLRAIEAFKSVYSTKLKSDDKIASEALEMALKLKRYIKFLRSETSNKKVISWANFNMLKTIEANVKEHKKARELLFESAQDDISFSEFHINWEWILSMDEFGLFKRKIDCKSLLDRIIINNEKKEITLVDIKTTGSLKDFKDSFKEYDYGRQMAFYWFAIRWYFEVDQKIDLSGYKNSTYIVAIQNGSKNECKVFKINDSVIIERSYFIEKILDKIQWHKENDLWNFSMEYYNGDGAEELNL